VREGDLLKQRRPVTLTAYVVAAIAVLLSLYLWREQYLDALLPNVPRHNHLHHSVYLLKRNNKLCLEDDIDNADAGTMTSGTSTTTTPLIQGGEGDVSQGSGAFSPGSLQE
jgi:hypothetical protein